MFSRNILVLSDWHFPAEQSAIVETVSCNSN